MGLEEERAIKLLHGSQIFTTYKLFTDWSITNTDLGKNCELITVSICIFFPYIMSVLLRKYKFMWVPY